MGMQNYGDADMETARRLLPKFNVRQHCSPKLPETIVYAFCPHARSQLVGLIYDVFGLVPMP